MRLIYAMSFPRTRDRHQAPAHTIVPDDDQQAAMQDAELLANDPPDKGRNIALAER